MNESFGWRKSKGNLGLPLSLFCLFFPTTKMFIRANVSCDKFLHVSIMSRGKEKVSFTPKSGRYISQCRKFSLSFLNGCEKWGQELLWRLRNCFSWTIFLPYSFISKVKTLETHHQWLPGSKHTKYSCEGTNALERMMMGLINSNVIGIWNVIFKFLNDPKIYSIMGVTERKLCSAMAERNQQITIQNSVQWHRKRGAGFISLIGWTSLVQNAQNSALYTVKSCNLHYNSLKFISIN